MRRLADIELEASDAGRALALSILKTLAKATDVDTQRKLAAQIYAAGDMMGLLQSDPEDWFAGSGGGDLAADEIESLIEERRNARAGRDFARADEIRDKLSEAGIQIEDGPDGTTWRRVD